MKWLLNLRLFTQGKISVWTLKQLFSLANFKSDWRGTIRPSRTSFPVFFSGSSSAKGRMFKKSLSYNVPLGLLVWNEKIKIYEAHSKKIKLTVHYVIFCFAFLYFPQDFIYWIQWRAKWLFASLDPCCYDVPLQPCQTRKFWWRKYSVGFKIPFEKTFITISYILLFFGQRSLIRNNTQIIFLFCYLGIKATENGVLLVARKFIHPVHLSA